MKYPQARGSTVTMGMMDKEEIPLEMAGEESRVSMSNWTEPPEWAKIDRSIYFNELSD